MMNWSTTVSSFMGEANSTLKPRCQVSATPSSVGVVDRTAGKGTTSKALTWSPSIVAPPLAAGAPAPMVSVTVVSNGSGSLGVSTTVRLSSCHSVA